MCEYEFWGVDDIKEFSKYCSFPINEHDYPYLFFLPEPFSSKKRRIPIERMIFFSYKFYSVYTDPTRSNTTIPGIVDLIKAQDDAIYRTPEFFMAPFLPEYTHLDARVKPPPQYFFPTTESDILKTFNTLSTCSKFRKRFTSFMGDRVKDTCPECCLYLTILVLKCSYLYYSHRYYSLGSRKVFCDNRFNLYLTQILLGYKPGIDAWPRRHAFIHKTYQLMIKTPYFLRTLELLFIQLNQRLYISIDEQFYKQFSVMFWARYPSFTGVKHNPTHAIVKYMIECGAWSQEEFDGNKRLYKLAVHFIYHHFLYQANSRRKSYYHSWVDTNVSKSTFLVVLEREKFPWSVVFVRYTTYMSSEINAALAASGSQ